MANSYKLKSFFSHTILSKSFKKLESDFLNRLSDVSNKKVLEIGCGYGDFAISLLKNPVSFVAGIDISDKYIDTANSMAINLNLTKSTYEFKVMDAHNLKYPDNFFDIVVGNGIIHHLDISRSLSEINRVLKPGGFAIFKEPLSGNPFLMMFRLFTPKARTRDERPLSRDDLKEIKKNWIVMSKYYGIISAPVAAMTSILLRPFPNNPLLFLADWLEVCLNKISFFNSFNQYVLLFLIKK